MARNDSFANATTLTELQQKLLTSWKSYSLIPEAANRAMPFICYMIGTVANTLLLIYLMHSGKWRIAIFALLTSLALCDWFTCSTTVFYTLFILPNVVFDRWGKEICKTMVYIFTVTYETSICHLVFLAGLRFYQLVYPLHASVRVTTRWVLKWCAAMWVLCASISIPYPMYYTVSQVPYGNRILYIYHFVGNSEAKEISLSICAQTIPLVAIVLLHVIKVFKVAKGSQITETERKSTSSRTVTLLIMCFVISLLPRFAHTIYHNVLGFPYMPVHAALFFYSSMITSANSIVDPFLYLFGSKEIRQDVVQMLRCKQIRKQKA